MRRARDTSPEAQVRLDAMLRAMSPEDRLDAAADASDAVRELVRAGIRARRPADTAAQVEAELARIMTGVDAPPPPDTT